MARKAGLPTLADLTKSLGITKEPRPIKVPKHSIRPLGPRKFNLASAPGRVGYGPGDPPTGFLTQWNSIDEWTYYWAICKVTSDPPDCRKGPFVGGKDWDYQTKDAGGRVSAGQVYDYIVRQGAKKVAIRLQTERYHVFASSTQQAKDFYLKIHSASVDDVFDIFTQNANGDKTGKAQIAQIAKALKGVRELDPIRGGVARRVR